MVKISIDKNKCVGCGMCAQGDPDMFEIDPKDHKAKFTYKESLSAKLLEKVDKIAKDCLMKAVKISDEESGKK